jgi:hypothetical protein
MVHGQAYHLLMRQLIPALCALALLSCDYELPLTAEPTRAADARLAGHWALVEPEQNEAMDVRLYDDRNYVIAYRGDLYRGFHSEVAGLPLLSVQNLNDSERKWIFMSWELSENGKRLTIRAVRTEVVPVNTRDLVKAIEKNRDNPALFGEPGVYVRNAGVTPAE